MVNRASQSRVVWLIVGVAVGLCVAAFWPHEPAHAIAANGNDKFAMTTVPVSFTDHVHGIFVLDFLTGQLKGAVLNTKIGKFTNFYAKNVALDFGVDPRAGEPRYAIVGGKATLTAQGRGVSPASGVIYIGELTSGRLLCYGFPYSEGKGSPRPSPLILMDRLQFREAAIGN